MPTAERTTPRVGNLTGIRELDSRVTAGMQVRLLWNQHDHKLHVTVFDRSTGDAFRLTVRDDEAPADVFNHPFAYAEHHGVHLRCVRCRVPSEILA
jgi:hypothetical protein